MPSLGFLPREVFIEAQTGGDQRRLQSFYSSTQFIAACAVDNTSYSLNSAFSLAKPKITFPALYPYTLSARPFFVSPDKSVELDSCC